MDGYQQLGYDIFLQKADPWRAPMQPGQMQQLSSIDFENFTPDISASKIQGGILTSPDGTVQFDIDKGMLRITDGIQDIISLGKLDDGSIGLVIKNKSGNEVMRVTTNTILLQSGNQHMVLDFNAETLTVNDDFLIPVVLLGKLSV